MVTEEVKYETNLYLYNDKDQQIINHLVLNCKQHPLVLLENVFEFLRMNHILGRYAELCIADKVEVQYNAEDGERELRFADIGEIENGIGNPNL